MNFTDFMAQVRVMVHEAVAVLAALPFPSNALPSRLRSAMPDFMRDPPSPDDMPDGAEEKPRRLRPSPAKIDHAMWVREAIHTAHIERHHRLAMLWRATEVRGRPRSWRSVASKVGCGSKDTAIAWEEQAIRHLAQHLLGEAPAPALRVCGSGAVNGRGAA